MSAELNQLIRQVAADHPKAEIHELARFVVALTPRKSVTDFYTAALGDTIRTVLGQQRRNAFKGPEADRDETTGAPNRSAKIEERQQWWWPRLLNSRVHVGESKWMQLGECTIENLDFCIAERRGQIAGYRSQIGNFKHLISLMTTHGVGMVKDLPEQTEWPS
jgi:hypothetical protein